MDNVLPEFIYITEIKHLLNKTEYEVKDETERFKLKKQKSKE